MNKRERVERTLAGLPTDRPPVCFWRHYGPVSPEETVQRHLKFFEESGMDILKMMCDEFFTYPMDVHATPAEILKMRPLGPKDYYVRGQVERASQINEALKGEIFTLYNAFSPYATLKHTMGDAESMASSWSTRKPRCTCWTSSARTPAIWWRPSSRKAAPPA